MTDLTTKEEVQNFIEKNPVAVIYKAGSCRQTEEALRRLNPFFKKYPDLPAAIIDVVADRSASTMVTGLSGKKHESPQILLFKDGTCVFEANHWRIEAVTVIDAVESHLNQHN
jgi:bacillithiol system protein YtxJ